VGNATTDKPKSAITEEIIQAMLKEARQGDASSMEGVRTLLLVPQAVDYFGDLAAQVERALIRRVVGNDVLGREAVMAKLAAMRTELGGSDATPVERLLIDRVVIGWLHLHGLEIARAGTAGTPDENAVSFERAITAAQKRYLAAMKALAAVRRLAIPALQINIAKKQMNVAGPAGGGATKPVARPPGSQTIEGSSIRQQPAAASPRS
jgi:hypothetical protein